MPRKYTKIEILSKEVFRRKEAGESNREIAESYGLTKYQIKQLVSRQHRKARLIANGYIPRPKGRPRQNPADEETRRSKELAELRMKVELLQTDLRLPSGTSLDSAANWEKSQSESHSARHAEI